METRSINSIHRIEMDSEQAASVIRTPYNVSNSFYGVMFDVRALSSLTAERMDFHTDLTTNDVEFQVYTKIGSYYNSMEKPGDWALIAWGTTTGKGLGKGTPIPYASFNSLVIKANDIQGFYVTLKTTNLGFDVGTEVGKVYASNADIEILEGSGVGEYPFGHTFFSPRTWNGAIYYSVLPTTASPSMSPTQYLSTVVSLAFMIETPLTLDEESINSKIDLSIKSSLEKIFLDVKLKSFVEDGKISVESVITQMRKYTTSDPPCTISIPENTCSIVNTDVSITHDRPVSKEEVRFTIYKHAKELTEDLSFPTKTYIGAKATSTSLVISLAGNNIHEMAKNDIIFFETSVKDFINSDFSQFSPPINITSVGVENQSVLQGSDIRRRLRLRSSSILYVLTTINGLYLPPPDINFNAAIMQALKDRAGPLLGEFYNNTDFQTVEKIYAAHANSFITKSDDTPENPNAFSSDSMKKLFSNPLIYISVTVGLLVFIVVTVILINKCCCKKDKKQILSFLDQFHRGPQQGVPHVPQQIHSKPSQRSFRTNSTRMSAGNMRSSRSNFSSYSS